jgi:excisionase family DNA binding protein
MDQLLTIDEVAKKLRNKPGTIRQWVSEKRIPYVKLGRSLRFRLAEIERFVEKNSIKEEHESA